MQSCNDELPQANAVYQLQPSISVSDINLDRSNNGTSYHRSKQQRDQYQSSSQSEFTYKSDPYRNE